MRLTFVFPRFKMLSGAERLILKLAAALEQKGHRLDIVCHQFHPSCRPLLPEYVGLITTGSRIDFSSNRYVNAAFDYFRNRGLVAALPTSADAVCCFGPALTAASAMRKRGISPVLYFCYEPPRFLYTDRETVRQKLGPLIRQASGPVFRWYEKSDRKLVEGVDRVLSNSEFGKEQIRQRYGRDADVITHGLDDYLDRSAMRGQIRRDLGIRDSDFVVITVNYLHPRKRIDLFVQALQQANRSTAGRILGLVVGDGPERVRLEQDAGPAVRFTGFVNESELSAYYQAADAYLHTGRLETFGLSVIEGAGNRLPVVSVAEGGPLETVIEGRTGCLTDADPEALARALLTLEGDRARATAMGQAGFDFVRNKYRWEKGAEDFLRAVRASHGMAEVLGS